MTEAEPRELGAPATAVLDLMKHSCVKSGNVSFPRLCYGHFAVKGFYHPHDLLDSKPSSHVYLASQE